MIIVEGMDNSGKSTLAKHLAQKFELEYLHSPSEYRNNPKLMIDWARDQMVNKRLAVYDRFSPISDRVYGPVLRGGTPYNDTEEGRGAVELLKETPHVIIYCRPGRERILNFGSREQMDGVVHQAIKLLEAYDDLMGKMQLEGYNIVTYNYDNPEDYNHIISQVKTHILYIKQLREEKDDVL